MKHTLFFFVTAILLGLSTTVAAADAEDYSGTIEIFRNSPEAQQFFDNSYGYAVFPLIGKADFVVGGSYGTGQVHRFGTAT